MKKIYPLFFLVFLPALELVGQGNIEDAELVIEKDTKISLPQKKRIFYPLSFDEKQNEFDFDFSISEPSVTLSPFQPIPIDSYKLRKIQKDTYDHLLIASFGTLISPYLYYDVAKGLNNDLSFGATVKHDSYNRGAVRQDESGISTTSINLSANQNLGNSELIAQIGYKKDGFRYYGLPDSLLALDDPVYLRDRVGVNKINLDVVLQGNNQSSVSYKIYPYAKFTSMNENERFNSENLFGLDVDFNFRNQNRQFGFDLDGNVENALYKSGEGLSRFFLDLRPGVNYRGEIFEVEGGLAFQSFGNDPFLNSFYILPFAKGSLTIDDFEIFAGVQPRYVRNTLYELTSENLFLSDSLRPASSFAPFSARGGIQGQILNGLSFTGFVEFTVWEQLIQYNNSIQDPSRFILLSSAGFEDNITQFTLGGDLKYKFNQNSQLNFFAKYHAYDQQGFIENVLHLPLFESGILGKYQFFNKFQLDYQLALLLGIKSYNIDNQEVINIPSIFDLSFSVSYFLNDQLTVFLAFGNLLNRENVRFQNYPVRPISLQAGLSFSF